MKAGIGLIAMLACGAWAGGLRGAVHVHPFAMQTEAGGSVAWEPGAVTAAVFLQAECLMSRGYEDRITALWREFEGRGVKWLAIAPNVNESGPQVKNMAAEAPLPFPVYRDPKMEAVDAGGVVRYRGAIDDARNAMRVKRRRVSEALEAALAGRAVVQSEGRGLGCAIKRR